MIVNLQRLREKRTYKEIKRHYYGRVRKRAQQLQQRTAFCGMLELVKHLSMAVSVAKICKTK